MSTCISRHGEFGSHELDDAYVCKLCGVLDEDGLIAELRQRRSEVDEFRQHLEDGPLPDDVETLQRYVHTARAIARHSDAGRRVLRDRMAGLKRERDEAQASARAVRAEMEKALADTREAIARRRAIDDLNEDLTRERDETRGELAAAKPEGWESVAALHEAYTTTDGWLEDARQECKRLRAALIRIAAEIPRLDGLDEERVAKGLEWIHQRACAALDGAAPSAVEAPAPDQTAVQEALAWIDNTAQREIRKGNLTALGMRKEARASVALDGDTFSLDAPAPERPCGSCNGDRWVDDENWQPEDYERAQGRVIGSGRIPCGICNHGGWSIPDGRTQSASDQTRDEASEVAP